MAAELATSLTPSDADRLLQAESAVRGYCGWHIAPERSETKTIRCALTTTAIVLPSLHVTAVTSVTRDGTALVEGEDFSWSESGVVVFYTLPVLEWVTYVTSLTELVIDFTHGYPEAPPEVTAVVQAIAQRAINSPGGLAQVGQVRYGEPANTSRTSDSAVLDRYRLPALP